MIAFFYLKRKVFLDTNKQVPQTHERGGSMSRMIEPFECNCDCHGEGENSISHIVACCDGKCPDCGKHIMRGMMCEHRLSHQRLLIQNTADNRCRDKHREVYDANYCHDQGDEGSACEECLEAVRQEFLTRF